MPLKFFLKFYTRLIGLTSVVLLLCVALFWGVNSVRLQSWQEHYPEPLMRWLASVPAPSQHYPWLVSRYELRAIEPDSLSPVVRERLAYGQVVTLKNKMGPSVQVQSSDGRVLQIRFRDIYRDVTEASALITLLHLNRTLPGERDNVLGRLAGSLSINLDALRDPDAVPDTEVLERVSERNLSYYQAGRYRPAHVLMRLDDGVLIQLDMPEPFNPWAWPVILLLILAAGGVLAGALLLLLRGVDKNLRAVESVAVRIARGEMDARVENSESKLVGRLAAAFNSMAEHIQRLVGVQREMIHAVSHELRTPVARIRFGVQMIEDCDNPNDLQKQLDGIDGDIQELDELIDEILTYARLEQGGPVFSLQETSVTDIIRQVVGEQRLIHTAVAINEVAADECEQWAQSDVEPRYLHRALQNLVGNAARYASGQVRVSYQLDELTCRVDVEDDGPGIPEEDWEKVFTAFARLDDSRTRTSGGYGLGLSIVRRILYWHGGQAFVTRSSELGGARFSLVWPRKKAISPEPV
ncbi:ATP-binding protein [Marinobacter caseinilyticus]|uniref:ATP-binding protein n=1 Tax=Marinobacter caseinilyticus TaxID=2692195 RepID=UPI00140A3844|nr:ATP-binding protein [Marinobacter caseinilyticus]